MFRAFTQSLSGFREIRIVVAISRPQRPATDMSLLLSSAPQQSQGSLGTVKGSAQGTAGTRPLGMCSIASAVLNSEMAVPNAKKPDRTVRCGMFIRDLRAITEASILLFVLCACSAPLSQPNGFVHAMQKRQALPSEASYLYYADSYNNAIDIYQGGITNPQQVGTITDGVSHPADVFVDAKHNVYVGNNSSPPTISVYGPNSYTPNRIVTMKSRFSIESVLANADGVIFVDGCFYYYCLVYSYGPNAKEPTHSWRFPTHDGAPLTPDGLAFYQGDLILDISGPCGTCTYSLDVFPSDLSHRISRFSETGVGAAGMARAGINELLVADHCNIYVYQLPLTPAGPVSAFGSYECVWGSYIAYDRPSNVVYQAEGGLIAMYDLGGTFLGSIPTMTSWPSGISVDYAAR